MRQQSLFESERMTLQDAIAYARQSLLTYASRYRHWAIAFSGGKDSTTALTMTLDLLDKGELPRPEQLHVLYANTRQELPMLHTAAQDLLAQAEARGCIVHMVEPPLDDRFFVHMLGRGLPPPHNGFRWCVGVLKLEPMMRAMQAIHQATGGEKFITLTGMRVGESAVRNQRIALSCSRNTGECSQGWYQKTTPAALSDVLAPILHLRVCHIADWLRFEAPALGFSTIPVIEAYGGDGIGDTEALESRTGCIRCSVAGKDTTLDRVAKTPSWAYLSPFLKLWDIYAELSSPRSRLRKVGERNKDGRLSNRPMRTGPLTFEARRWGLAKILELQSEVNEAARQQGRPEVWLIPPEDEKRILELIDAETWPDKWTGQEARATDLVAYTLAEGVVQPFLAGV